MASNHPSHGDNPHQSHTAQPEFMYNFCVDEGGYFTSNSYYEANLDSTLSSFSSNTIGFGFCNFTVGQSPDTVNTIALCRGDVEKQICQDCVSNAARKIRQLCPTHKEAIGWYELCMLRYSNRSILGTVETYPGANVWRIENVSNVERFNQALENLLDSLRNQAQGGGPPRNFASGNTSAPDFLTIYGLVQCTPDISELQCSDCSDAAAREIPHCCNGRTGGTILKPSCNLRYSIQRFYNRTPTSTLQQPHASNLGNHDRTFHFDAIFDLIGAFVIRICIYILIRERKNHKPKEKFQTMDEFHSVESLQYDFITISVATDYFSDGQKLGQGGFGPVFKGRLPNGQEIAVKRLSRNSGQGELEFKNEVLLVAKLQHRNLVRLLGFSLEGTERLLIYELLPNASLDHFIFDPSKRGFLNWEKRFKIIGGVARGLLYLHEDSRL